MNKLLLPLALGMIINSSPLQTAARANETTRRVCEGVDGQYMPSTGMCIRQNVPLVFTETPHGNMFIYPQGDDGFVVMVMTIDKTVILSMYLDENRNLEFIETGTLALANQYRNEISAGLDHLEAWGYAF
jgi:hypothetical protein